MDDKGAGAADFFSSAIKWKPDKRIAKSKIWILFESTLMKGLNSNLVPDQLGHSLLQQPECFQNVYIFNDFSSPDKCSPIRDLHWMIT